jgi:quercetin dioxygenase-like cupin family protein
MKMPYQCETLSTRNDLTMSLLRRPRGPVKWNSQQKEILVSARRRVRNKAATKGTFRPHQPGEAVFKSILPEEIDWKPFPAFPPSARLAIVVGQPLEEGPYTIRVKVPAGVKLMPHRHPEDRVYTVISGVFYIGLGDEFDTEKLQAYSPGAVIILPGNTSHFPLGKIR